MTANPFEVEKEASIFDDEAAFEQALSEMVDIDPHGDLERMGRIAADITLDLQDRGALYRYVAVRRQEAIESLKVLAATPPDGPENIARIIAAQASFFEFRRVIGYIDAGLESGQVAEDIIKEEYGHGEQDADLLQEPEPAWRRRR